MDSEIIENEKLSHFCISLDLLIFLIEIHHLNFPVESDELFMSLYQTIQYQVESNIENKSNIFIVF